MLEQYNSPSLIGGGQYLKELPMWNLTVFKGLILAVLQGDQLKKMSCFTCIFGGFENATQLNTRNISWRKLLIS
jgi:hypothetical protein